MKKIVFSLLFATLLNIAAASAQTKKTDSVQVAIDLNNIQNDKVTVTITPPKLTVSEIVFHFPKTVPGTYSEDNYGKYIENFRAFDSNDKALEITKMDLNSWKIANATKISKITYQVNDTFDTEKGGGFGKEDVFSPAGSNIEVGKNFLLNTHAFVGYFDNKSETPYKVIVYHPASIWGATSMADLDASTSTDIFETSRYAELVENPIMYSKPDYETFNINGMAILIAVYSPNGTHTAASVLPELKKVMIAQKNFLGKGNATKKYSVLIYLSDVQKGNDAMGFGALEHPTATTVVMPESMPLKELSEQLKDVVSHEFFHIVTPLTVHSKEIQYFNFSNPKMSQHLWMYEGVTEYFANLFQVNQGLITEDDFYNRMSNKIANASRLNDTMSFTKMSENVLKQPYKDQYLNVYEKGALIGMCLDIIIREKSKGKRGILDLMQKLAFEYGATKPFNDNELFAKITALTYPEVGKFLLAHVSGTTPINYSSYFAKMGITNTTVKVPENVFLKGQTPYITVNQATKQIIVISDIKLNAFFNELGVKGEDIIVAINDKNYNLDNVYEMVADSENFKNNDLISIKIIRDGKSEVIKGKVKLSFEDKNGFQFTDSSKKKMKEDWLKGI